MHVSRQFAGSAGPVLNSVIVWLNVCGSVVRTRNEDYDDECLVTFYLNCSSNKHEKLS